MREQLAVFSAAFSPAASAFSIRQHTSEYDSIRPHTSAYVSIRQNTSAHVGIRLTCRLRFESRRELLATIERIRRSTGARSSLRSTTTTIFFV
jgi:hypothetical protein